MSQREGLNRRTFLRNAGMTALVGAVGPGAASSAMAATEFAEPLNGKFDFDTPYSRIGTDSVKYDQQIRIYGKDHIQVGMGIADMDFKAAPCIGRALAQRCQHENWGYLDVPRSYYEAIASWNKRRYGLDIDPETIVLTTGVHPGLIAALRTFSPPGTRVLLTTPTYNGFYGDLNYTGTKPEDSPMKLVNGRYSIDFEDLERRMGPDTNTLILCNPQNPTGNCWSADDLMRLGELCLKKRVVVLADEIHCDFVTKDAKYTPFASLPNKEVVRNSLTFKAASKSFSLAAMKNAWFFSTNPEYLARVKALNRADLSTLGMVANNAALTEGEDWLNQLLPYIEANHEFTVQYIKANMPLVKCVKPQGTYLAWLDVSAVVERIGAKQKAEMSKKSAAKAISPEQVTVDWFVEHAKVHLNAGSSYGTGGQGHVRMNIATSRKTLEQALNNLSAALKTL
jgi:cystathionine beta-lyase